MISLINFGTWIFFIFFLNKHRIWFSSLLMNCHWLGPTKLNVCKLFKRLWHKFIITYSRVFELYWLYTVEPRNPDSRLVYFYRSSGIAHDAIACAAFLKFHPLLPKQGAQVITRPPQDVSTPRHQRHSVEVSNAGNITNVFGNNS